MKGRVLSIGESDPSGGAGIQADIKTVLALGGYATTAVTALTAQNTKSVSGFMLSDPAFVGQQIRVILDDIGTDTIKTGILGSLDTINAVADILDETASRGHRVVVDPAIVVRPGNPVADPAAIAALKRRLFIHADIITPSLAEAEMLTGMRIKDVNDMRHAADMLRTFGVEAVILRGGAINADTVVDLVVTEGGEKVHESPRRKDRDTYGMGCTLAAALAVSLAQGLTIQQSMERALDYINGAIEAATGLGSGQKPLEHAIASEFLSHKKAGTA